MIVKHAGEEALDSIEGLLRKLREYKSLTERKRGVFYIKARAFIHFHEDARGLFADLKAGKDWKRFPVSTKGGQRAFLSELASLKSKT